MLEAIDNLISKTEGICTTKESEFLYSIRRQFVRKGELSFGQRNWFTSIEAKYSQEELQAEEAWRQAFGEEQRQEAIRVADYYAKNPPYYSQYIERVHQNPDSFILSRKEWARFCENKYAWKVRQSYKEDLKYDQGSLVQIRKSNRLDLANYNTMSKFVLLFSVTFCIFLSFFTILSSPHVLNAKRVSLYLTAAIAWLVNV